MVVYYVPEQARFGGGSQQSIVAQGEPVREGQKLMQIPDLKHMLVNTKVHEALVVTRPPRPAGPDPHRRHVRPASCTATSSRWPPSRRSRTGWPPT